MCFYIANILVKRVPGNVPVSVFFFWGTHNVRDELQLSHFVG